MTVQWSGFHMFEIQQTLITLPFSMILTELILRREHKGTHVDLASMQPYWQGG
jgi:kynurenine formamidase